jgi:magnesium-transporting ATPase (P-type)
MAYTPTVPMITRLSNPSNSNKPQVSWWVIIGAFTRILVFFIFCLWMIFSFLSARQTFDVWIMGFIANFQSELAGIAFTLVVLDFLRWLGDRSLNKEVNEVAQEVVNLLQQQYRLLPISSATQYETSQLSERVPPFNPPLHADVLDERR